MVHKLRENAASDTITLDIRVPESTTREGLI